MLLFDGIDRVFMFVVVMLLNVFVVYWLIDLI